MPGLTVFMQVRISSSAAILSLVLPPHQYFISCSTQHELHTPSGHLEQISEVNSPSGLLPFSEQYSSARIRSSKVALSGVFANITVMPANTSTATVSFGYGILENIAVISSRYLSALAFVEVVQSQRCTPVGEPFNKVEP